MKTEYGIGCLVFTLLLIPNIIWRAWVITKVWSWLFVSQYSVPELSIFTAYGLSLLVGWLVKGKTDTKTEFLEEAIGGILVPAIVLFFAFLATLFM